MSKSIEELRADVVAVSIATRKAAEAHRCSTARLKAAEKALTEAMAAEAAEAAKPKGIDVAKLGGPWRALPTEVTNHDGRSVCICITTEDIARLIAAAPALCEEVVAWRAVNLCGGSAWPRVYAAQAAVNATGILNKRETGE